jgi:hypothetical protein
LFGEDQKKTDHFISRFSSILGKLYDDPDCMPAEVPLIPQLLNLASETLGSAFPSYGVLGNDMAKVFTDVFRQTLTEDRGQCAAVQGLQSIMKGRLSPEDCASWLGFMVFSLAFIEFCKLAAEAEEE